jgi:hypothetical protein
MREDDDTKDVLRILNALGLSALPISATHAHKTPDILVEAPDGRVLIEVEGKPRDRQVRDLLDGPAGATLLYRNDRVRDRVHSAWRQIRDYPGRQAIDSTVIWLLCRKRSEAILTGRAARASVLGTQQLEGETDKGAYYDKPCFFFHESLFFSHKELDAVVIDDGESIELCLNPYGPRYATFRDGALAKRFRGAFAVLDPVAEEAAGRAFIADCAIDRRDTNEVVRYLRQKYQIGRPTIWVYQLVNVPVR